MGRWHAGLDDNFGEVVYWNTSTRSWRECLEHAFQSEAAPVSSDGDTTPESQLLRIRSNGGEAIVAALSSTDRAILALAVTALPGAINHECAIRVLGILLSAGARLELP